MSETINRPLNRQGRVWSREDVNVLMAMRQAGAHQTEIAAKLGRTVSSVEGKVRLLREGRSIDRLIGETERYETPPIVTTNDRLHLERVIAQGGFTWKILR